jgi:hypothetical protein
MAEKASPVTPLTLLSDEPIRDLERDGLGLEGWARVIAGIAIGTEGPFTVGVFGSWGVGKTSILRLAANMIDQSEQAAQGKITTVSFNAWEYEQESSPIIPLLASIVYELNKRKGVVKRAKGEAQKLHDALRSLLFGLSTKVSGKIPLVGEASLNLDSNKAIERYETLRSQWIDQQIDKSLYYKAFQTLRDIQADSTRSQRHRVAVFIDDLDRCFPDRAIQLLESIKLVLNHPGFIFVLAVDRRILESYLDKRYSEEFGLKHYHQGQSYLDKIVQLPLWVPPHEKRFNLLIETLLARPEIEQYRDAFEPLLEVFGWACEHNPRQLIRLFNDIMVGQKIYQLSQLQGEFPLSIFVIAHGIRHQSDLIYQGLLRHQSLCKRLKAAEDAASLQDLLGKLLKESEPEDMVSIVLRGLQTKDSLVRLLTSDPGKEWLKSATLRGRVDSFLAAGWSDARSELDEINWIQEQVQRALAQLDSPDEDVVMAACEVLLALGDHTCLPALKLARTNWKGESRAGKALFKTYQKLIFSYGAA